MVPLDPTKFSFLPFATFQIVLILTFYLPSPVKTEDFDHEEKFCPIEAIVDLTYATKNASGFLTDDESGFSFPPWATRNFTAGVRQGCICDLKPCLPLCPPVNRTRTGRTQLAEDFVNYEAIPEVYTANLALDNDGETRGPEERFHFLIRNPCPGRDAYFLEPGKYENDEFRLLGNGSLFLPRRNDPEVRFMDLKKYCLRLRGNDSSYTPKVCSPESPENIPDVFAKVKYVGCLVAVPFLIATVIVYSVLPELRNIHGTTLRCYLCCLIVTFVSLAADRIPPPDLNAGIVCLCLGFTIYASFLASFFWLNVMCFDMWCWFGGSASPQNTGAKQDRDRFVGYSIYAWGIPVVLTAFCIGMEFSPAIPKSLIRPGFRFNACWFSTQTAEALYFYGPISLILVCNICLFISASMKVFIACNGDGGRYSEKKQWFRLLLKLFVVMGISWSTEIISWLWKGPKYFWYFTDTLNALQGILIFVIFVCKRSIWWSLKKHYNKSKKQLDVVNSQLHDYTSVSLN